MKNKKTTTKPRIIKVMTKEEWEINYFANKMLVPEKQVREAIKTVGNNWTRVETYINQSRNKSLQQTSSTYEVF